MSIIPCSNVNEKMSALQAAATALGTALKAANLPAGHPLPQAIADAMTTMALQINKAATGGNPTGTVVDMCGIIDTNVNVIHDFGRQLAEATGKANVTSIYLDSYTSSSFGTLLMLGVVVFGGWYLYKWFVKTDAYPLQLAPRYAGGRRRG